MRDALGALAWTGVVLAALVALRGGWYRHATTISFGVCMAFYSLTGENYISLIPIGGVRDPLNTSERIWGATSAVIAGCALMGALMAIRRKSRDPGSDEWTDPDLHQRLMMLVLGAAGSVAIINLTLVHSSFPPSADFLADYGHVFNVVLYEAVFSIWIGLPAGFLAWTVVRSELGKLRFVVGVGGIFAVAWSAWKIIGTGLVWAADIHVAENSPISVTLGLLALSFCMVGTLLLGLEAAFRVWRAGRTYRTARALEDRRLRHRSTGEEAA
ncbi:hypothetical protein [Williamsia soli]|uniref:hypothetical protein n=1 Tax=Williamsia soli TaxID=364929 RepID=UPI001A9E18FF|nr:hypothetical protein [Williamsia soli]